MLIDLIRANAIIHQFQRTREEKHGMVCVTATMEDFQAARSLYTRLSSDSGGQTTKLTRNEAALIQAIQNLEQAEVTIPQLQRVCGSSYRTIYQMIHGYTSRGVCYSGLLEKCPALSFNDRTITDQREGTNVRRRTKAYQWDALIYETWCTDDSVWISRSVLNEGDSGDSDDHNGSDLRNGQQYQHVANICCP